MGNLNAAAQGDLALASVNAGVGPTFGVNRGFSAVVRNGAGDYSLTLDNAQNLATAAVVNVTIRNAAAMMASVVATDTTHLQVLFLNAAGAAADPTGFYVRITPLSPN